MRRGDLATELATRMTYVADIGVKVTRMVEEVRQRDQLIEQLAALQAKGRAPALAHDHADVMDAAAVGDVVPQ